MMRTLQYGPSESHVGDLYTPAGTTPPVVCLLHGGFWKMPYGRDQMSAVAADLADRGYAVWNVEYRRTGGPGGGWPGTLEDVAAAIDHLAVLSGTGSDLDLRRVAVVGHSAGGQLALCSSARRHGPGQRFTPGRVFPVAAAGLAAILDLESTFHLNAGNGAVSALLGGPPDRYRDRYREASPLSLLPLGVPQLILHGTADDALPVEISREYVRAARQAGDTVRYVEMPGLGHMEYLDPASGAHAALCGWLNLTLPPPHHPVPWSSP